MSPESKLLSKGLNGIGCGIFLDALASLVPMAEKNIKPRYTEQPDHPDHTDYLDHT